MAKTTLATPEEPRRNQRSRRKRTNGEGSIWPRKDGRYGYAAYVLTTAGTVKRVQGYARSSEDARKKLTELIRQSDQGVPVASENWTVAEYLTYWLRHVVREERRPKTHQGYESVVRLHLMPGLGKKLYVLALYLGLQRGELLGLRWADVDLDGEKLEVVQTLQRVGGKLQLVPPKTEDSAQTVPLPTPCVEALREHRKQQFAERSDAWPDCDDHGLVFPSRRGTPMEPDNLRRSWDVIRRSAGLGSTRFHDLRHTCVTLLLDLGVSPHVVREIVGHSDIEVTMTIYAHASLDGKRKALRKLGDALG